jgi:RHS repeat-associated protein
MGCSAYTYCPVFESQKKRFKKELTLQKTTLKAHSSYLYGFGGKETDNEVKGAGNSYDFGARMYDARLGRWLSVDPYYAEYPMHSNYSYAANSPMVVIDKDGKFLGTIIGAVIGGAVAAVKGDDILKGATAGAIAGAAADLIILTGGTGALVLVTAGAVSGAVGSVADQTIVQGKRLDQLDGKNILISTALGGGLGFLGAKLAGPVSRAANRISGRVTGEVKVPGIIKPGTLDELANAEKLLQEAADEAIRKVGSGKGSSYGTKVHSQFKSIVDNAGQNISTEVSYLNGKVVPFGTKGSVRLDAVVGDVNNPTAVFDLKTGGAQLTAKRIEQIRKHLPEGSKNIPIDEIRPTPQDAAGAQTQ